MRLSAVVFPALGFPQLADGSFISKKLSPEQAGAAQRMLECRDRFAILAGIAGVGKTTLLTETDRILTAEGMHVAYCAPTAS